MKKFIYCLTLLIVLTLTVACGSKNPGTTSQSDNNPVNKITYTKEFTYLPSYNGIKSTAFTPASEKEPLAKANYIIPNTTDTKAFDDYEAIFKKDGWTITQEKKVISFSAKKQDHVADISFSILNNNVIVTIKSK